MLKCSMKTKIQKPFHVHVEYFFRKRYCLLAVMMLLAIAIIFSVAWITIKIVMALKQRANTRTRARLYERLIDKFETAPEFITFLQSDAGLQFIEETGPKPAAMLGRILVSIQIGIVVLLLSLGLVLIANVFGPPLRITGDFYQILTLCGMVGVTIAVGLLVSAGISYRICKAWGLLTVTESKPAE